MVARKWQPDAQPPRPPLDAPTPPPATREDGFALLRRISELRRAQGPGYTGDLDALEALVWSMLFRGE